MAMTPRALPLFDDTSIVQPIQTPLNAITNAVDSAITAAVSGIDTEKNSFIGTAAQRAALSGPQLRNGITWFETDTNISWRRINNAWRPDSPFAMATGTLSAVSVPIGGIRETAVTFPSGRFTLPPVVTVSQTNSDIRDVTVGAWKISATGMTVWRGSMATRDRSAGVHWIAVQMTPTSATG